jgi:hypothetical protein
MKLTGLQYVKKKQDSKLEDDNTLGPIFKCIELIFVSQSEKTHETQNTQENQEDLKNVSRIKKTLLFPTLRLFVIQLFD